MTTTSFEELKKAVLEKNPGVDISLVEKAFNFAEEAHRNQKRDEGTGYFQHPFRVALNLSSVLEFADAELIATALLHDTLEDCPWITMEMLKEKFGDKIAGNIFMLSKVPVKNREERENRDREYYRQLAGAPWTVRLVKMADRIDNLASLHLSPRKNKIKRYVEATRKHILPMAQKDFPWAARKMEEIMDRLVPLD